ncbi:uncharacterized protein TNCV_943381 [Trichonephila clavipes]|nr:uncharacterized protein TNCV_943381 [Trichonephila clavipes]
MTPELAPPLLTTTPHQREDVSGLDRFSMHRCPTWRVFSGTGLELVTKPATIRHQYHLATAVHKRIYGNNMLTKYQMIKFIDFCEEWFLPESVARVAAIAGDHRYHTPRH